MKKFEVTLLSMFLAGTLHAQQITTLTKDDYKRAERFLAPNTQKYVDNVPGKPTWLSGERFWYRTLTAHGSEFILVNALKGTRAAAFDHVKLAASLSKTTGGNYTAFMLPFQSFDYATDEKSITFEAGGKQWKCDLKTYQLRQTESVKTAPDLRGGIL